LHSGVHVSENRAASFESDFLLNNPSLNSSARCTQNTTVCIIKPHSVLAGDAGKIVEAILSQGFQVSAIEVRHSVLSPPLA
jgi:nucleoside-diphosphate kinase